MHQKNGKTFKWLSFLLIGLCISSLFGAFLTSMVSPLDKNSEGNENLHIQNSPICSSEENQYLGQQPKKLRDYNGLGEIEINSIFIPDSVDFNSFYITLVPTQKNITAKSLGSPEFLGTINPATAERSSDSSNGRISNVTILMNETIRWDYFYNASEKILGYKPYFEPVSLRNMYLNHSKLSEDKYLTEYDGESGFFYNFTENFENNENGTIDLTYEYSYDFPVVGWSVTTISDSLYLSDDQIYNESEATQKFVYKVSLGDIGIDYNVRILLNITLPDRDSIFNVDYDNMNVDDSEGANSVSYAEDGVEQYDNFDNELSYYLNLTKQHKISDLEFDANFTFSFLDVVDDYWYEDQLVNSLYERERKYKMTVSEGPETLKFSKFWINETTIYYPQLFDKNSERKTELGRDFKIENMNYSTGFYPSDTPINETTPEFPEGVSIFGPQYYLWKGEVDIISLRYEVVDSLSIVLTDEINNPVSGYKLNLYRGNQLYGPKMNNFKNHPIATKETNQNGQVTINFVPKGEYTVEVLDKNGNFITNLTADAKKPVNVLKTNITHFPATVLSLLSTSIVLIVVGLYIYNKHNNE